MKGLKIVLNKIQVGNFLSLRDVELPLKPLTILVGPNASGKSNVLKVLKFLRQIMTIEEPPGAEQIQDIFWADVTDPINFHLQAYSGKKRISYKLDLRVKESKSQFYSEDLIVDGVRVISVKKGKGEVKDEDNQNPIPYHSTKLALKSAGAYGHKPLTNALTDFIRDWKFYDFDPDTIRTPMRHTLLLREAGLAMNLREVGYQVNRLGDEGSGLTFLLANWSINDPDRFEAINETLKQHGGGSLERRDTEGGAELYLVEGLQHPIPLEKASDGTLRLLAYYVLLHQPESPALIAIEEPERNLHPRVFKELSKVLKALSQKTQIVITTHSSQLLDTFDAEDLSNTLNILLLRNKPGNGTQVTNLQEIRKNREAVRDWMDEFGLGSAIFESQLLQDVMEI